MKIFFAASEAYPFAATGGLADVIGSLPTALAGRGHEVSLVMPFYGCIEVPGSLEWLDGDFRTMAGENFGVAGTTHPVGGYPVYFVASDEYFTGRGIYGPDPASAYDDNAARFAFFARAVAAMSGFTGFDFDIMHCHDWQTGLVPVYLRNNRKPASVFTVHNLHFKGVFPRDDYAATFLPWDLYTMEALEFHGDFSFIKGGLVFSRRVTTVSPTYAREMETVEFGEGLEGVIGRISGKLTGILNGIDYVVWDPSSDPEIAARFSAGSISGRKKCGKALREAAGLDVEGPVLGVVSRLTFQKGIDLLFPLVDHVVDEGAGLVVLGTGDPDMEERLTALAEKFPGKVSVMLRFDESMARRIFAGCDILVMPSRFEPCGLAQMIGMRYGSVPLVRRTGGLADTVTDVSDGGWGFVFETPDVDSLSVALDRAINAFRNRKRWPRLVNMCMTVDNSWENRVPAYEEVYRRAIAERSGN